MSAGALHAVAASKTSVVKPSPIDIFLELIPPLSLLCKRRNPPFSCLLDEIQDRIDQGPIRLLISVQIAAPGDITDDSTARWPQDRPEIPFGTVDLTLIAQNNAVEQQHIIFDPDSARRRHWTFR